MARDITTTGLRRQKDDVTEDAPNDGGVALALPLDGMVARRYQLLKSIGFGGHGEVFDAIDTLSGERVAVKLLMAGIELVDVRKEVSALRLVRVPGVVRLLDEGSDRGRQFLVMERVEGSPFPGNAAAGKGWQAIAGVSMALLETMARIHAMGVVHRDIKPTNVLVNDQGRPVVLDFGIAVGALGEPFVDPSMVGTPAYMAPEQMRGEEITARADLFALGGMLYEALAGALPYAGSSALQFIFAKETLNPKPLRDVAPEAPVAVAAVIDRMVARDPEDRPASAAEVLRVLRGEARDLRHHDELPRLGGRATVDALCAAVLAGQRVDLVGPHGSGRSRTLRDLAEALRSAGRRVMATAPGTHAFESLTAALAETPEEGVQSADPATGSTAERLHRALTAGAVLLVDDLERVDRTSAAVIARSHTGGGVVRAVLPELADRFEVSSQVKLGPLDETALRDLFAGPERVFHLPSDAASALWSRTEGWPARVYDEISAWVRAGLTRRDGDQFAIDREALDRLATGHRVAPLLRGSISSRMSLVPRAPLPPHLEDLLTWLSIAWPHTALETLVLATGLSASTLESELLELEDAGAVRRLADDRWEPVVAVAGGVGSASFRRAAHRALAVALRPGTEGRQVHLVAGADAHGLDDDAAREVARESIALARARAAEGRLGQAIAALAEGLLAARRVGDPRDREAELLGVWVELALDEGTPRALDRVRYELCRANGRTAAVAKLEALVEAAQAWRVGGDRGLDMVEAIEPFDDVGLEMRRQNVRIQAARRCSMEREARAVEEATRWAADLGDPSLEGQAAEWGARLQYRLLRFDAGAELLASAVRAERDPTRKLSFSRGLAVQLIEAFEYTQAAHWASETRALARAVRNPYAECFGEHLLAVLAYRSGREHQPDVELVRISARVGNSDLEAVVAVSEAASAARSGRHEVAAELAAKARAIWSITGWLPGVAFCRAVELFAGVVDNQEPSELAILAIRDAPPRIGLQLLALLVRSFGLADATWPREGLRLARSIAPMPAVARLEVLSRDECMEMLGASDCRYDAPTSPESPSGGVLPNQACDQDGSESMTKVVEKVVGGPIPLQVYPGWHTVSFGAKVAWYIDCASNSLSETWYQAGEGLTSAAAYCAQPGNAVKFVFNAIPPNTKGYTATNYSVASAQDKVGAPLQIASNSPYKYFFQITVNGLTAWVAQDLPEVPTNQIWLMSGSIAPTKLINDNPSAIVGVSAISQATLNGVLKNMTTYSSQILTKAQ